MMPRKLVVGPQFLYTQLAQHQRGGDSLCLCFMVSGVSVMKGQEEVHIHAPLIISDAGIFNTYQKLIPKDLQTMPGKKGLYLKEH